MSRFKTANDVTILQSFDLPTFQQGVPGQPALLLKYLSLENKGGIHDAVGNIQESLSREQAGKRQRSKENRAASVPSPGFGCRIRTKPVSDPNPNLRRRIRSES